MANVEIDGVNSKVYTDQVDPKTGTTLTLGTSGDTVSIPSGVTITNSGTDGGGFGINATNFRPNARPLIINGDMTVAQRSTSVAGLTGLGYQTVDRYSGAAASLGTWTQSQDTSVPTGEGFSKSLKMDCTTANASPSAGGYVYLDYAIEAQDLQLLKYGSSSAETITVAFWVKAYQTGVMQLTLYDWDNDKIISASYEIDSSATWEKKILTFAGNTSANFTVDNAKGLSLWFPLDTGSNYESGALRSSWTAYSAGDFNPAGAVNVGDNTNNYWQITGLQLEVGEYTSSTIPPFQHESYGNNLARCQRYFQNLLRGAIDVSMCMGRYYNSTSVGGVFHLPVSMRAAPTVTSNTGTNYYNSSGNATNDYFDSLTRNDSGLQTIGWYSSDAVSGTQGFASLIMTGSSSASVFFVSEL